MFRHEFLSKSVEILQLISRSRVFLPSYSNCRAAFVLPTDYPGIYSSFHIGTVVTIDICPKSDHFFLQ